MFLEGKIRFEGATVLLSSASFQGHHSQNLNRSILFLGWTHWICELKSNHRALNLTLKHFVVNFVSFSSVYPGSPLTWHDLYVMWLKKKPLEQKAERVVMFSDLQSDGSEAVKAVLLGSNPCSVTQGWVIQASYSTSLSSSFLISNMGKYDQSPCAVVRIKWGNSC